jgi:hypothetical protein
MHVKLLVVLTDSKHSMNVSDDEENTKKNPQIHKS